MTCKFTKLIAIIPGAESWTGQDWAHVVLRYWWDANWGLPTVIISDRDPKFVYGFWSAVFDILKVKAIKSTAHHSQADGQSERMIQTVEMALRHWLLNHKDPTSQHTALLQYTETSGRVLLRTKSYFRTRRENNLRKSKLSR